MKKIILLVLLVLILCSCNMQLLNNWYEISGTPDLSDYTEQQIYDFVLNNIDYENYAYGYQETQITWDTKKGNCCNRALLALALIYKYKDIKENLLLVSQNSECYFDHATITGIEKDYNKIWESIGFDDVGLYIQAYQNRINM